MVDFGLGVMVGMFLLLLVELLRAAAQPNPASGKPAASLTQKATSRFPFSWKPEAKPEATVRPVGTISRTKGSWRRQRLEIQRQHNSKQKERDALTNPKEQSHATKTR